MIAENDPRTQIHDFAPRLKNYLERKYQIRFNKIGGRARFSLPSGVVIYIRGCSALKNDRGLYHLDKQHYEEIVSNANQYFAVVFDDPKNTFVFPKIVLTNIFERYPVTGEKGKRPRWYFDIRQDKNKYFLKVHSHGAQEVNINRYLNGWDQIKDFKAANKLIVNESILPLLVDESHRLDQKASNSYVTSVNSPDNDKNSPALWVIRAGKKGERERNALEQNEITIGWTEFSDFLNFKDIKELKQYYHTVFRSANRIQIGINVAQIWTFVHRIKKGDNVILPLRSQSAFAVAEVIGDYVYRKNAHENLRHTREVKWLGTISRSDLDRNVLNSIGAQMTVFQIKRDEVKSQLMSIVGKKIKEQPSHTVLQQQMIYGMGKESDVESIEDSQHHNLTRPTGISRGITLFKQIDYNVSTLIDDIAIGQIGLPNIQRPFVWNSTKVRDLIDSMYNGFPVGYLLFWANAFSRGPRLIGSDSKQKPADLLVIDGQQRLTSLYTVMTGRPIGQGRNTQHIRISFRPRDGTFEVANATTERNPEYIPDISVLWSPKISHIRFIKNFVELLRKYRFVSIAEENIISDAIDNLHDLQNYRFTVLELSGSMNEEQVAEVFVRINSQGTKLNQGDFILTLMSVFWDQGRTELELFCENARQPSKGEPSPYNHLIEPDPDQLLRVSVALGFRRARLKFVYSILRGKDLKTELFSDELRVKQFGILMKSQEWALDLTNWHEFIKVLVQTGFRSKSMITSKIGIVYSYAMFLIGKRDYHVNYDDLRYIISSWFFMISLSGRYTNSPETIMESDLARLRNVHDAKGFVDILKRIIDDVFTDDFWNITLPNNLATTSLNSPSLFAYDASLNLLNAYTLFSERKVSDLMDPALRPKRTAIERHHLFPKKYLNKIGIDPKEVNQIANYALLEWPENVDISGSPPAIYFSKYSIEISSEMKYWHALPDGWEHMSYVVFLEKRRKLIARVIRDGFKCLSKELDRSNMQIHSVPLETLQNLHDLIKQGESNTIEFKSSMRKPAKLNDIISSKLRALEKAPNSEKSYLEQAIQKEEKLLQQSLEHEIFKTIAAFMNSEGGILLVGIEDDGTISGIERDFETFNDKKNWDGWLQHFTNLVREHIGIDMMIYLKAKMVNPNSNKTVAIIEVRQSSKPVYVEYKDNKGRNLMEFYIRATSTTYSLNPKQINDYIRERWKGY
jgi:hypothetical protein